MSSPGAGKTTLLERTIERLRGQLDIGVIEGDDKPAKYPQMFATSQVMIVNKLDLLPFVDYNVEKVKRQALAINPHLRIFEVSCRTGAGLDAWCEWLIGYVRS